VLDVEGLTYRYGDKPAVEGLSFRVPAGSVCGLVGPNGAGKTTTMRAVLGLLRPSEGSVHWEGRPAGYAERRRFSYFPAQRGLFPRMRVAEQLAFVGRIQGMDHRAAATAAARWLDRLGVAAFASRPLQSLSEGEQQRVQLAACFLHAPALAVLDEPFTLLDIDGVTLLTEVLGELAASGTAVLVSSHQLDVLEEVCDGVAIMTKGRLVVAGVVAELRMAARRVMRLRFAEPAGAGWAAGLAGVDVAQNSPHEVVLHLGPGVVEEAVVAAAARAGTIVECSWSPPRLRELYRGILAVGS
jgi:ABC-2 type transport system ATP-binding protein